MKEQEIKVGFLTKYDPKDKRSWSGTISRTYDALEEQFSTVIPLGPINKPFLLKSLLLAIDLLHRIVFRKKFNRHHNKILSKFYAKSFEKLLKEHNVDVIFSPAASTEIALLKTDIPICYLSDTSFGQLIGYHGNYLDYSESSIKESHQIETLAIRNSKAQVYPSHWAADYVIKNYGAEIGEVYEVPFGANIDYIPTIDEINKRNYDGPIDLLFLSVEWQKKGGDIAFSAFQTLLDEGYDVSLTVCGCIPPVTHEKMHVIPFLNKNKPDENKAFMSMLLSSHILFVPTRADCWGIVFCEAGAFGLTSITTDTGGVGSIIKDGVNGHLLPMEAGAKEYAVQIATLLNDRSRLQVMGLNARSVFEESLNWHHWGEVMRDILIATSKK